MLQIIIKIIQFTMKKYILMVVTFIITLVINSLANILPLNNQLTAAISDKYPTLFTPANYVFSIWGLIYLSLTIMLVYLGLNFKKNKKYIEKSYLWFVIANLANALWMFAWHYEILPLSIFLMIVILFSLLKLYSETKPFKSNIFLSFPVSIYLGWISVATIANISAYLPTIGFTNVLFTDSMYSVLMIAIAIILGILMLVIEKDFVFKGVILWAVFGILVRFQNNSVIYNYGGILFILGVVVFLIVLIKNIKLRDLDSN